MGHDHLNDAFNVPRRLARRYELRDELGRGGMGIVYRCLDRQSGAWYAVKFLTASRLNDKQEVRRFQQEAKVLTLLKHPHIIRVVDYGIEEDFPYLVSELCVRLDGRPASLEDIQQSSENRRVDGKLLESLAPPVIGALAALHQKGLIHRDIKPSNILLQETAAGVFTPKLSDFGLVAITGDEAIRDLVEFSMSIEQESATSRSLVGTYSYMSPEQKRGDLLDARSDVYSLGLMLYRLATGYERVSFALPSEVVPELPAWFDEIVKAAVEMDASRRAPNAAALLVHVPGELRPSGELEPLLQKGPPAHPVKPADSDSEPHLVRPWMMGAAVFGVGVVIVALIAGVLLLRSPAPEPSAGPSVQELLYAENPQDILAGLMMLEESLGESGQDFLPRIRAILTRDPELRREALPLVCELSRDDPRLRPLLLEVMGQTPDSETARRIIDAAQLWEQPPTETTQAVHRAFSQLEGADKARAASLLDSLGVPAEQAYLDYHLYREQLDLAEEIAAANPAVLLPSLFAAEGGIWRSAVTVLRQLEAPAVVDELVARLADPESGSGGRVRSLLISLDEAAVPALTRALKGQPEHDRPILAVLERIGVQETAAYARYFLVTRDLEALRRMGPPAVPVLKAALSEPDLQSAAVEGLGLLGDTSGAALPSLLELLRDGDVSNDAEALAALGNLGPRAREAIPAILPFLRAEQGELRVAAAGILHRLEVPVSYETWPYFRYVLEQEAPPEDAYRRAIVAAGELGGDLAAARQALVDLITARPGTEAATIAAEALGQGGRVVVPIVRRFLQARDVELRRCGVVAATAMGTQAEPLIRELTGLLGHPSLGPAAGRALIATGEAAIEPAIGALADLRTRDPAIEVLAALGQPAMFRLRNALTDGSTQTRQQVLYALHKMADQAASAVPDLRRALLQPSRFPPEEVLRALAAIGPRASSAIPEIEPLVASSNPQVGQLAIEALAGMGKPGLDALGDLMDTPNSQVRQRVLNVLLDPAAEHRPDVDVLVRAYRLERNRERRPDILQAIGRYGADGEPAVPLLLVALEHPDSVVRRQAALALGQVGLAREDIIAKLRDVNADDADWLVRESAGEALRTLQRK